MPLDAAETAEFLKGARAREEANAYWFARIESLLLAALGGEHVEPAEIVTGERSHQRGDIDFAAKAAEVRRLEDEKDERWWRAWRRRRGKE